MRALFAFALALVLHHAAPAAAQDADDEVQNDLIERIRILRMYAITEALGLDAATAAKLIPVLQPGDDEMERLHRELRQQRAALRKMANGGTIPPDAEAQLKGISDLEVRLAQAKAKQLQALSSVLTVEQRVRFYVAQARFEEQVRAMVREAREQRREERREERREQRREGGGR